jgi:hypothetical protein
MIRGWKVLTHDLRPPIQGGPPIFDGTFPALTEKVLVDTGIRVCSYGWNFTRQLSTAFAIAGYGRPGYRHKAVLIEAEDFVRRGDKYRTAQLKLIRFATSDEIFEATSRYFEY